MASIGYSSAGALAFGVNNTSYQWPYQSDGTGGVLSTAHVALANVDGSASGVKLGIYNMVQTGTHDPSGLSLVDQVEFPVATVSDDNNTPAIGGTLAANTWYGLAWSTQGATTTVKYDNGAAPTADDWYYDSSSSYATEFADPCPTTTYFSLNRGYSIWWDYAPASSDDSLAGGGLTQGTTLMSLASGGSNDL
jgi:hypothetical protein